MGEGVGEGENREEREGGGKEGREVEEEGREGGSGGGREWGREGVGEAEVNEQRLKKLKKKAKVIPKELKRKQKRPTRVPCTNTALRHKHNALHFVSYLGTSQPTNIHIIYTRQPRLADTNSPRFVVVPITRQQTMTSWFPKTKHTWEQV